MSSPLSSELKQKHSVSQHFEARCSTQRGFVLIWLALQVRSVPIRKDDEVTVVRGTYKVRSLGHSKQDSSSLAASPALVSAVIV